jgi:hypothetical protein
MRFIIGRAVFFAAWAAVSAYPGTDSCTVDCISRTLRTPVRQFMLCLRPSVDTCFHSDDSGKAVLALPGSTAVSFTVSAPGYADTLFVLDASESIPRTIVLRENGDLYRLPSMTVVAPSRTAELVPFRESGARFTSLDITATAGAADDLSRYIGTLPSVVSGIGDGYNNTFYVRGGRSSETVFLVDGIEMENINHFSKANGSGGPIGFLNTSFIDTARFFAGPMPASLPSRLSSAVDIRMKAGSLTKRKQTAGCKLTGGVLSAEGPIMAEKGSYAVSGRYVDFTPLRRFIKDAGIPALGDAFGKIMMASGESADISATGLISTSSYRFSYPLRQSSDNGAPFENTMMQKERIDQGGAGVSFRWRPGAAKHEANVSMSFRHGMNADSLEVFSDSFFVSRYAANPVARLRDNRRHFLLSTNSVVPIFSDILMVSFGLRVNRNDYAFAVADESRHTGTYIFCIGGFPDTLMWQLTPNAKSIRFHSTESGAFAEGSLRHGMLRINAGCRADYYALLHHVAFSPRISWYAGAMRSGIFSGGIGLYHQFPTDIPTAIFSSYSAITGASDDMIYNKEIECMSRLRPPRCWQGSCGYSRRFSRHVETMFGAYYKWYDREYDYLAPEVQDIFSYNGRGDLVMRSQSGRRKAFGAEFSIGTPRDRRLFYSLAGSCFDVQNKYGNGEWHNDWTNVRYAYSCDAGCRSGNSLLSISFRGSGGLPTYVQRVAVDCMGRKSAALDTSVAFFSRRLGSLFMANAKYAYSIKIGSGEVGAFLEVLNVFNYRPALAYKFNGDRFVEVKPFGITPILGCTVQF